MNRVLVIEDDKHLLFALEKLLVHEGFEVIACKDGMEGLRALYNPLQRPDCIVLDLIMPAISGWDFLRVRNQDPQFSDIPIIVLSAASDGTDAKSLEGATIFMPKPLDSIHELGQAILRVIRHTRITIPPSSPKETP